MHSQGTIVSRIRNERLKKTKVFSWHRSIEVKRGDIHQLEEVHPLLARKNWHGRL